MTLATHLDWVLLEVRGDDARSWLNGQLTCDVNKLEEGRFMQGLRLNKNGRAQALVTVLPHADGLDLLVPREKLAALLEDLDRFIIMEDVELAPRPDARVTALLGGELPRALPRGPLLGHDEAALHVGVALPSELEARLTWLTPEQTERLRVEAGEPGEPELNAELLPQEAGLKGLVSFTKGCYLGQEPVVMLEHRGKTPKQLARLTLSAPASPGDEVALEDGASVGVITSAASEGDAHTALALLKKRAFDEDLPLRVGSAQVLSRAFLGHPPKR